MNVLFIIATVSLLASIAFAVKRWSDVRRERQWRERDRLLWGRAANDGDVRPVSLFKPTKRAP